MSDEPSIAVETAETINLATTAAAHPAVIWIVGFVTCGVLLGFGWVTFAVLNGDTGLDAATKGSVIQTWNNLAVAAAAVWTAGRIIDRIQGKK